MPVGPMFPAARFPASPSWRRRPDAVTRPPCSRRCWRSEQMSVTCEHPVEVRWRDVDALGHVNHAVFLTYLEEGRDAFFTRALGDPAYVVVRLEVDLRAGGLLAARRVTVRIAVERLGRH